MKIKAIPSQIMTCVLHFSLLSLPGVLSVASVFGNPTEAYVSKNFFQSSQTGVDTTRRKAILQDILRLLPPDNTENGRVSYSDSTFQDWLERTGELPPDFEQMPSIPHLPNPLIIDEGRKNTAVTTLQQWQRKRIWMKKTLQYYITGTFPPKPDTLSVRVLNETKDGTVTLRKVELRFGPGLQAKLTLELIIPPGEGPFPVFLTQWNHRGWAQVAVRRGYAGCIYAGSDDKDDTEGYAGIWANQFDFTRIMRRAFAASRAIDYLYTLSFIDKDKIGLTGHSRNGKLSLWAAAFDERITAVIPSSGGSGGEVPWRFAAHKYDVEDIALLACAQPAWLHPRLRFFIGREDQLPVDQNSFMALIAPRGLMLSAAVNEVAANTLGIEQAYLATKKVYQFLGAEDHLAIRLREGQHGTNANDIEAYIDFFDYFFKRSSRKPENKLVSHFNFESWQKESGEQINPEDFPIHHSSSPLQPNQQTVGQWEAVRSNIQKKIQWTLGEQPPQTTNPGPGEFTKEAQGEKYFGSSVQRPVATTTMGRTAFAPYREFGNYLYGYLYYPKEKEQEIISGTVSLPAVIYLHEFDYSKGFSSQSYDHAISPFFQELVNNGYVVFSYDMIGFGTRLYEGKMFYQRYPKWSKMGNMITDVQSAVTALTKLHFIDSTQITVVGYSLGATVGLFASALDSRIAKVVSVCGYIPLQSNNGKGDEGLKDWSHLYGLIPKLGFFTDHQNHLPFSFADLLSCTAPRPMLLIAPELAKDVPADMMRAMKNRAGEIYKIYGRNNQLQLYCPRDYNRFSAGMQKVVAEWLNTKW